MAQEARAPLTATSSQRVASVVSTAFLIVGVLGFIPGVTTNLDAIRFGGHQSEAELLGVFQVSVLHNIVHLLFGLVGLAMARTAAGARYFLLAGGLAYLALWIYGLLIDHGSSANFVPLNTADNWLHLGLGLAMLLLGLAVTMGPRRAPQAPNLRTPD